MRSVAQFYEDCLRNASQQPPLDLALAEAVGCVLAEDVVAPFDHPMADVAAQDGYAVRSTDVADASLGRPIQLMVTSEISAGEDRPPALVDQSAARIASGAPLPQGADAVVDLEETDLGVSEVTIKARSRTGMNVRYQAEDMRAGETILPKGTRLGPAQIAAIAAVGRARVIVHPRPRVVVLSIGDELIEPGNPPRKGAVFDANGQALTAAAAEAGAKTFHVAPVADDRNVLRNTIDDQLMRSDLIITTGGISHGAGNTVREVLGFLGNVRFDQVAASPGHLLGVGTVGDDGRSPTPIFCLPGDPVSAQICFEVYVRPALRKMQGWKKLNRPSVKARMDRGFKSPAGKREFVRVRLRGTPREGYLATVMGEPASPWISALAASNALAIVPEDVTDVAGGELLTCMLLD